MNSFEDSEEDCEPETSNTLDRRKHIASLIDGLTKELPSHYDSLAPAQTWVVYWISHSLALLEQFQFLDTITEDVIEFTKECAHKDGGYGGGPGQIAHLGTTFAAINSLITTSSEEALDSIDRIGIVRFLHRMKQADGSFSMHDDGEIDSRATYCALSVLRCLNIQDSILLENVSNWILSCQTYEGGFGSVPGSEAHGGYTFCCVASLCLLNQLERANLSALLRWLTSKQLPEEGGFCGRSNKLVDSCYSYWQGAVFPLIHPLLKKNNLSPSFGDLGLFRKAHSGTEEEQEEKGGSEEKLPKNKSTRDKPFAEDKRATRSNTKATSEASNKKTDSPLDRKTKLNKLLNNWLFDCAALQDYVLNQCQGKDGLLRDKPGTLPDFYHTCYALSGLSLSQHQPSGNIFDIGSRPINIVTPTHPLFNLTPDSLNNCFDYFSNKKIETFDREELKTKTTLNAL